MSFAPVNGIQLYYEAHGSGPPVVFAHGSGGNHLSWWQQVPFFSHHYTCITFDHRSFGYSRDGAYPHPSSFDKLRTGSLPVGEGGVRDTGPSTAPGQGSPRAAFADDLKGLLDHLGIEQVAIVAHSMGGRTGVGFTIRNPGRVKALVLSGSNGGSVNEESRRAWDEQQERNRSLPRGTIKGLSPHFVAAHPERAFLYRQIMRLNPRHPAEFLRVPPGYRGSTHERLAAEGLPVLYIVGEEDAIAPPRTIEIAASQMPNARLVRVAGAGHSTYFEQPERFNQVVLGFLREVYPPR